MENVKWIASTTLSVTNLVIWSFNNKVAFWFI